MEINKTQKIALLMAFHTEIPIEEQSLMTMMSWVINGVDEDRIDWGMYLDFAQGIQEQIQKEGEINE